MADPLKIVGVSTSPRRGANTSALVKTALGESQSAGDALGYDVAVELVELGGRKISACLGCDQCARQRRACILNDDWHELVRPLTDPTPHGIVIGSPVYFFNQNALGRAYMERCTSLIKGIWDPETPVALPDWSTSAAGALAVGFDRNGGVEFTLTSILQWFLVMGFATVGGFYVGAAGWTHLREDREAMSADPQGIAAAKLVGRRVARLAAILKEGKAALGERAALDVTWRSLGTPPGGGDA